MPAKLLAAFLLSVTALYAQSPIGESVPGRYIVLYREGLLPQRVAPGVVMRNRALGFDVLLGDPSQLNQLPGVQAVVQDRVVSAHQLAVASGGNLRPPLAGTSNGDEYLASPQGWAVTQTVSGAWNQSLGHGVRIAILDSGVDAQHPDIAPNLALNLSEVDRTAMPSPCDDGSPQDQQGHGTFSASLAAGAIGAYTGMTAGVAPQAQILNIKVLQRMPDPARTGIESQCSSGQASGLLSWTLKGIQDAIENHADVISMSFGTMVDLYSGDGAGVKVLYDRITHAASQAGVVLVAAAGNDGFDFTNSRYIELPAQARDVLAVVATTNPSCAEDIHADAVCRPGPVTLPYYSNRGIPGAVGAAGGSYPAGSETDVTGWIRAACSAGLALTLDGPPSDSMHSEGCFNLGHQQYVRAMGTSASAPLVAGIAALLKSRHPDWTSTAIIDRIRLTAQQTAGLTYSIANAKAALGDD